MLALELVEVFVHALHRSILGKQLLSRLGADARHTWDVVGRIAHEAQIIRELGWRDAVFFLDHLRIVDDDIGNALLGRHDMGEVGHELIDILVARNEQRLVPLRLVARRHSAQDVVALPTLHFHDRDVHRLE